MKIACDLCGKAVEDSLMQMLDRGKEILYVCPECYVMTLGEPPEEQP